MSSPPPDSQPARAGDPSRSLSLIAAAIVRFAPRADGAEVRRGCRGLDAARVDRGRRSSGAPRSPARPQRSASHRFAEAGHRHRVVARSVVARDRVEVDGAGHVARRRRAVLQLDQGKRAVDVARRGRQDGAFFGHLGGAEGRHDVGGEQRRAHLRIFRRPDRKANRQPALPAELGQVVGDAADHVGGAVLQVDMAVAVEVDRVLVEARRHELRHADGAGVAAGPGERLDAFALAEHEPALELVLEEVAAVAAAGRKVEGERRQRIDDAKVAHLAAIDRLDADDADDDLRRHAVQLLGGREPRLVGLPELRPGLDADRLDEAGAIGGPVLRRAGRRRHDVARDARHEARLRQRRADPGGIELAALGQRVGEAHDVVALAIGDEVGSAVVARPALVAFVFLRAAGAGVLAARREPAGGQQQRAARSRGAIASPRLSGGDRASAAALRR